MPLLLRWFVCWMTVFILQKVLFMLCTWHDGTQFTDVLSVTYHGLKLDVAVTGYILIIPWIVSLIGSTRLTSFLSIYFKTMAVLTAIIFVADASLYPFWQFKLDASIFLYTDKPKDALASVSAWFVARRVLWVIGWTYITLLTGKAFKVCRIDKSRIAAWARIVLHVIIGGIIFIMIRGGVTEGTNNVSAAYYSDNQYLNHSAVNPVFNLLYSLGKQQDFASEYQFYDESELSAILKGIYHTDSEMPDTLLTTKRPDIILIVWEGLCEQMAGAIGGDARITPYLNKIAQKSINFTNCYANSWRTDRGLVCLMAGYPALANASLMKIPEKNEHLPALPRTLAANGYATTFWYGGDISFTNMGGYMHQAGFQRNVSDRDFTSKELTSEWGAPDEHLFNRVMESIGKSSGTTFNAVMTLSSHEPWDVPTHRLKDDIQNSFNYADECIGKFIERLSKTKRWKNTLVIITGDHGVIVSETDTRYGKPTIHIPMIWTGGAIRKPMTVSRLMNQSDLAATLLGQLGISHDDFTFSRDVMSKSYVYPTATHCYSNGITFIDSTGATTYDCDAEKSIAGPDKARECKAKGILQITYKSVSEL